MGLIPQNRDFFNYFERMGEVLINVGKEFRMLCDQFPAGLHAKADILRDLEHEADTITHEIIDALNKTFVTPLDREDIHALAMRLDDVIDLIENAASNFVTYHIADDRNLDSGILRKFGSLIEEMTKAVANILRDFRNFKKTPRRMLDHIIMINSIENRGDDLFKEALSTLFMAHAERPVDIIRWKDIYETLENSLDKAEDVANVLEAIAVKYT